MGTMHFVPPERREKSMDVRRDQRGTNEAGSVFWRKFETVSPVKGWESRVQQGWESNGHFYHGSVVWTVPLPFKVDCCCTTKSTAQYLASILRAVHRQSASCDLSQGAVLHRTKIVQHEITIPGETIGKSVFRRGSQAVSQTGLAIRERAMPNMLGSSLA